MLYLSKKQKDSLVEYSQKESPNEACGILAGKGERVEAIYLMRNADNSAKTFFMEPKEQLKVMKEIRNLGLEMIGIYHSHLETDAYPSTHDVELAYYPSVSYVIVSIKDKDNPVIRSFKMIEGEINEEEVLIQ